MPTYNYICTACKVESEEIQRISEAPLITCLQCKQQTLQKVINPSTFHLKGHGWTERFSPNKTKKSGNNVYKEILSSHGIKED